MNKKQLIATVAQKSGLSQVQIRQVLDTMQHVICEELSYSEVVVWAGFGTFQVKFNSPRKATNLQTGEVMELPARIVPHWNPAPSYRKQFD